VQRRWAQSAQGRPDGERAEGPEITEQATLHLNTEATEERERTEGERCALAKKH